VAYWNFPVLFGIFPEPSKLDEITFRFSKEYNPLSMMSPEVKGDG